MTNELNVSSLCFNSFVCFLKTKIELFAQLIFILSNSKVVFKFLFCNRVLSARFYSQVLGSFKRVHIKKQKKRCCFVLFGAFDGAQMKLSMFKLSFKIFVPFWIKIFKYVYAHTPERLNQTVLSLVP